MKLLRFISAAVIAAAISAVCAVSAAAQNVPLDRISDSTVSASYLEAVKMTKNRTVKNELLVGKGEALVIPNGCRLTLKKGAEINGTLYIEEGGYLAVSGGTLKIGGSVVSDGTIAIGSKAGLRVYNGSELFVSKNGTLKISSTDMLQLSFDLRSIIACEGRFIASGFSKNSFTKTLCAKPAYAVKAVYEPMSGSVQETTAYTGDEIADILPKAGAYASLPLPVGGYSTQISVIYDNGCCIKFDVFDDKIISIGDAGIASILYAFETTDFLMDNLDPVYDHADPSDNIVDGFPLTYEELQEYLDTDNMNLLRFEILDVYSPKEAVAVTKNTVFQDRGGATLFKARLTYDYLNDKPIDIEVNIAHPGTDKIQYDNFPLYGVGEEYIASFSRFDLNEADIVPVHELEFAVRSNGSEERAFHLRFGYVNFITPDGRDLDMGIPGGQALVVTTTKNNPIKYVHMYDIDELAEFFRNDWTARGYKFSKL